MTSRPLPPGVVKFTGAQSEPVFLSLLGMPPVITGVLDPMGALIGTRIAWATEGQVFHVEVRESVEYVLGVLWEAAEDYDTHEARKNARLGAIEDGEDDGEPGEVRPLLRALEDDTDDEDDGE